MVFSRDIYQELLEAAKSQQISIVFGPRQIGKTYLLKTLSQELGKESSYFNLEYPEDSRNFNQTEEDIFEMLKNSGKYVFIDEFHYVENISKIFKAIYDYSNWNDNVKIKIYASGSSAIEMHKHLKESMAGRFRKYQIRPLNYQEFKTNSAIKARLNDYIKFGGLPGVYNKKINKNDDDRKEYLRGIYSTYIQKDVKALIQEENISAFNNLVYILAEHQGQIMPSSNLAKEIKVTAKTVDSWLDILEQTFILNRLGSYAKNLSNELKKSKKYYFYDLGIRNAITKNFDLEKGLIWESFTYHHLLCFYHPADTTIYFWRTADQVEIDFIWEQNRIPTPIEVKSDLKKPEVPKAFKTFFRAYTNAPMGIVMNERLNETVWFMDKPVHFVSFENIGYLEKLLHD